MLATRTPRAPVGQPHAFRELPAQLPTSKLTMPAPSPLDWTIGPYRIAREIGRGQFGTVYEARDPRDRPIALKLVPLHGPDSEAKLAAERQGADLQQRFSSATGQNRFVPEVLDHQRIDPYYTIVMELVSGQPLTALIASGRIRDDRAATIAHAICRFLMAAHAFTTGTGDGARTILVHGDLKPAHILLLADGSIRVLDFGIAKALAASKGATTNLWSSVDYASPERLESGRVNEHVDLWSLGVMLFEMVSRTRPYAHYEHSRSRLETAIRTQEPRLRVPADVDPRLTAIIDKLLAPQIENRYQSATQAAGDLQAFLDGAPVVAFIEATRANQATLRVSPVTPANGTAWNRPTEPLPKPTPPILEAAAAAPVRPALVPEIVPASRPVNSTPGPHAVASRLLDNPWVAAALSLLAPGLGQIYNRDFLRGLFWLVITPGFWIGTAGLLGWPFHLLSAYTAYRRGSRRPEHTHLTVSAGSPAAFAGP